MIRYLIIMQKDTGIPLFSQSYGFDSDEQCENFNGKMKYLGPDMLGGFIATLMGFGTQFNYGTIDEISFQEIQIFSQHAGNIVTVAVEEKRESAGPTKELLGKISSAFLKRYHDRIDTWDGDSETFHDFGDHLLQERLIDAPLESYRACKDCPDSKHCIPKMIKKGSN